MPKAVIVNYRECTGYRICELACSIRNEGVVSTQLSRIRVYPFPPGLDVPVVCVQCDRAPCFEVCPLGLLSRDPESRAVVIQGEPCNGCGLCMDACPAQAIFMHPTFHIAIKCHLCQGEPECVKLCPTEALSHYELPFDTLPKRILTEPLPSGIAKGQKLTQAQLNPMLDEYYKLRGWNIQTGTPSKEKLRELELNLGIL